MPLFSPHSLFIYFLNQQEVIIYTYMPCYITHHSIYIIVSRIAVNHSHTDENSISHILTQDDSCIHVQVCTEPKQKHNHCSSRTDQFTNTGTSAWLLLLEYT